jgi:hypothetical protein
MVSELLLGFESLPFALPTMKLAEPGAVPVACREILIDAARPGDQCHSRRKDAGDDGAGGAERSFIVYRQAGLVLLSN